MAGQIPPQFIDDLLTRVDITDVIDARVPLKKAGKNLQACCPFHNEKTLLLPSVLKSSSTTVLVVAPMVQRLGF